MTTTGHTSPRSTALYTAAAEAMAAALPTALPVTSRLHAGVRDAAGLGGSGEAVAATFVGELSADVALQLDSALLGAGGAGLLPLADVLRPSLEAATSVLGVGVLSHAGTSTASSLLDDAESVVFALLSAGQPCGWFALRVRDQAATGAGPAGAVPASAAAGGADVSARLGRLHNVEMSLTVEIGRTRMSVRDVLNLEPGAVVELDRSAGAPADVLLNGRLIAHGEVVVMDQDYGIRITQILDASEGHG